MALLGFTLFADVTAGKNPTKKSRKVKKISRYGVQDYNKYPNAPTQPDRDLTLKNIDGDSDPKKTAKEYLKFVAEQN